MTYLGLVVPVILAAGMLGGMVNKFLLDPAEERPMTSLQHIVVGIAAALTVPVLLNMISSTLVVDIKGGLDDPKGLDSLLILAGFCLLAAISSRTFIRSMSERILKDHVLKEVTEANRNASEARTIARNAEAIAELNVEPDTGAMPQSESMHMDAGADALTPDEDRILDAMARSRFTMRTVSGLARDSTLAEPQVNGAMPQLASKGLVASWTDRHGNTRWYATPPWRLAVDKIG